MNLIYLDNAATSHPKPREVYEEVNRCIRAYCGNPGRGSHPMALAASEKIYECRTRVAAYFHAPEAQGVVFTLNATYAVNLMLKGLLHSGDHILISDMEHNAVLRPVVRMARDMGVEYDVFPTLTAAACRTPAHLCAGMAALIKPNTRAVVCAHQSNLCSAVLPLAEIGALCREHGLYLLVDASQSAGHVPIDMQRMGIDVLCAPGHKGLLGIQGCGFAVFRQGLLPDTLIEGGSGYASLEATMPDELPERAEAGTLPTPAIAGLCAGLRYLQEQDAALLHAHDCTLFRALRERLDSLGGYRIYLPEHEGSTLTFVKGGHAADRIGAYLGERGICVRTGYHCAALAHRTLHSPEGGGVRVSFGPFNTLRDVDALWRALRDMTHTHDLT